MLLCHHLSPGMAMRGPSDYHGNVGSAVGVCAIGSTGRAICSRLIKLMYVCVCVCVRECRIFGKAPVGRADIHPNAPGTRRSQVTCKTPTAASEKPSGPSAFSSHMQREMSCTQQCCTVRSSVHPLQNPTMHKGRNPIVSG